MRACSSDEICFKKIEKWCYSNCNQLLIHQVGRQKSDSLFSRLTRNFPGFFLLLILFNLTYLKIQTKRFFHLQTLFLISQQLRVPFYVKELFLGFQVLFTVTGARSLIPLQIWKWMGYSNDSFFSNIKRTILFAFKWYKNNYKIKEKERKEEIKMKYRGLGWFGSLWIWDV